MIARVMSLVAQMEAVKARIEGLKRQYPKSEGGGDHLFMEASVLNEGS